MDPYSSSGYRSDRAREQSKAFKTTPPAGGFLAPGFPVDTVPPPSVTAPAAGAGASAAGGFAAATIGALAAGGFLGYKVRQDIKKWDKTAVQPFYDAAKWLPKYSDEYMYSVGFDPVHDMQVQQDIRTLLALAEASNQYWETHSFPQDQPDETLWIQPQTVFPPGGWYHPDYIYCPAAPPGAGSPPNYYGTGGTLKCGVDESASLYLYVTAPFTNPAVLNGQVQIEHYIRDDVFPTIRKTGQGQYDLVGPAPDVTQWQLGTAGDFVQPAFQLASGDFTDADTASDNWLNAAAQPGSYLSFDEQLVEDELGHGDSYRGWFVPFSLNHPFTVLHVLPGSPPVTVPDVVIDPGTATEPGSITIVPPAEPPFADASEFRQQKPDNPMRKVIRAGTVAINFATETNDLFQALAKGLPKKLRPKGPRGAPAPPWAILQAIWDHWDQFDSQVAMEAFVNNQIEDAIYGRYFGLKAKAQRRLGVSAGLARGVRGTPYTRQFSGTQTLVVPEVHFAHGQHTVSFGDYEVNLVPGS